MLKRLLFILTFTDCAAITEAALIVNPARPITHRVTVQLIQTALDSGTSPATVFGNSTQRVDIEAGIDAIWAQAGIDLYFLPTIVRYNDTFAYRGNNGSNPRSVNDLPRLYNNARTEGGILHSDNSVLNLFFVDVVPGFTPSQETNVAGVAAFAANGAAAFVGNVFITSASGRDIISTVIAHEIGHNLGLSHTASAANLMSSGVTTGQLTASQINTAIATTRFVKPLPVKLAGDYNGDNMVNAADYIVWRKTLARTGVNLPADGNNNGQIDTGDFALWKTRFGVYSSSGAGGSMENAIVEPSSTVPEPDSLMLLMIVIAGTTSRRR